MSGKKNVLLAKMNYKFLYHQVTSSFISNIYMKVAAALREKYIIWHNYKLHNVSTHVKVTVKKEKKLLGMNVSHISEEEVKLAEARKWWE